MTLVRGVFSFSCCLLGHAPRRLTVAYFCPEGLKASTIEEVVSSTSKGPDIADALALVSVGTGGDVPKLLTEEAVRISLDRLAGRVPVLYCEFNPMRGKLKQFLLDKSFSNTWVSKGKVLEKTFEHWSSEGVSELFGRADVVLKAPPGYAYLLPSGKQSSVFIRPDMCLSTSSAVDFVALVLFARLQRSGRKLGQLRIVFVDSMVIFPVALALRELVRRAGSDQPIAIESFHSYQGFSAVPSQLPGGSICLISASTTLALHRKWMEEKRVPVDDVFTLVTLIGDHTHGLQHLVALDGHNDECNQVMPKYSIAVKGDIFLPVLQAPRKVLLAEKIHKVEAASRFCNLSGKAVFDVFRSNAIGGGKPRSLYVDGKNLIGVSSFREWVEERLFHCVRASTRVIVFQDDRESKLLAEQVEGYCRERLGLQELQLVSSSELEGRSFEEREWGAIVCAAVVGRGSLLQDISRVLRDKHDGSRLYVIGAQVSETGHELKNLTDNLKKGPDGSYEACVFLGVSVGRTLLEAYQAEVDFYTELTERASAVPPLIERRLDSLRSYSGLGNGALLPFREDLKGVLELRSGFVFWRGAQYSPGAFQAEVLGTIATVLQRSRENSRGDIERSLSCTHFRQVVLDPENFSRYNDGVIQAALLRCAHPSELDYRGDSMASAFMRTFMTRIIERFSSNAGEAVLEFLLAIAMKRVRLVDSDLDAVLGVVRNAPIGDGDLRQVVDFLFSSDRTGPPGN